MNELREDIFLYKPPAPLGGLVQLQDKIVARLARTIYPYSLAHSLLSNPIDSTTLFVLFAATTWTRIIPANLFRYCRLLRIKQPLQIRNILWFVRLKSYCFHNTFCIFYRYHRDKDHSCQSFSILPASAD